MIVSHKHGFIFFHNPKCAGTSMRQALAPYQQQPRGIARARRLRTRVRAFSTRAGAVTPIMAFFMARILESRI